jgi:hypothetical protein
MTDRTATIGQRIGNRLAWVAAAVALAGTTALIVLQLIHTHGVADSTTLGLVFLTIVLAFAVAAPHPTSGALKRITTFKVAGIEVGLGEIKLAERVNALQIQVENDGVSVRERQGDDYGAIVKVLKERLQFVWNLLSLERSGMRETNYISTTEWLRSRELLTYDEESLVRELLKGSGVEFADWSPPARSEFLDSAWTFAIRFGALIWDRNVRRALRREGWEVFDYTQDPGHRPDFLAFRGGSWAMTTARLGDDKGQPEQLDVAARRLARSESNVQISDRWIVIPDISKGFVSSECHEELEEHSLPDVSVITFMALLPEYRE